MIATLPVHRDFGVEVKDLDLRGLTRDTFPPIRALFEEQSLLVFRDQQLGE